MKKQKIVIILIFIILLGYFYPRHETAEKIEHKSTKDIIKTEEKEEQQEESKQEEQQEVRQNGRRARITSYWENDDCNSEDMTASGKSSKDFQLNDKGWYTWNGMLVIATASTRLGKTNQRTYRLYEEIYIKINDIVYKAVVLDVCGACMRDNRIDLYVKDRASMVDQIIEVYE